MIQPLANRVLVKPDPPPDLTESGLVIPDNAHASKDFEMSGTVVKVGHGPASAHKVRESTIVRCQQAINRLVLPIGIAAAIHQTLDEMRGQVISLSEIRVGDHVAFPYTAGTVIIVDGERYLLMNEDQIVAILNEVAA